MDQSNPSESEKRSQVSTIASSDPVASNPLHANITPSPRHTPDPVRIGLAVWSARYVFRGLYDIMTNTSAPEIFQAPVRPLRQLFAKPIFDKINARLAQVEPSKLFPDGMPSEANYLEEVGVQLQQNPYGQQIKADIDAILKPWKAKALSYNTIQYAVKPNVRTGQAIQLTNFSKDLIKSEMSAPLFAAMYDNTIAAGSLGMTYAINKRIRRDVNNMYAEAVGYEKNKDPSQVTMADISASDNEIVQSTVKNYRSKLAQRLTISSFPLLKNVPSLRVLALGDIALGAWGVTWALDVWGRQPTMLELFSDFVNDKLNPKAGIGDPVKTSDVISLYQHYAFKFHPDHAFKSVRNDPGEVRMWEQSERVFSRIAELLNDSYNFKHTAMIDPATGQPMEFANFTFPKFIYLLGHNLIDAHKPDWSMAYIEIANSAGMDAVKSVERRQRRGANLADIVKEYNVNLHPYREAKKAEEVPDISSKAQAIDMGISALTQQPKTQVDAAQLAMHGPLNDAALQHGLSS